MKHPPRLLLLLLLTATLPVLSAAQPETPPPAGGSPTIDGYPGARWGATPDEVRRAFGSPAVFGSLRPGTYALTFGSDGEWTLFSFVDGRGLVHVQETHEDLGAACERTYREKMAAIRTAYPALQAAQRTPGEWARHCGRNAAAGEAHVVELRDREGNRVTLLLGGGTLTVQWARAEPRSR
jgi:hypothetical protein